MFCRGAVICPGVRGTIPFQLLGITHRSASTHYDVLQVSQNASQKDIKQSFHSLSKKFHPDLHQGDSKMHEKFVKINEAYSVLSNKVKRMDYDRQIDRNTSTFTSRPGGPRPPPSQGPNVRTTRYGSYGFGGQSSNMGSGFWGEWSQPPPRSRARRAGGTGGGFAGPGADWYDPRSSTSQNSARGFYEEARRQSASAGGQSAGWDKMNAEYDHFEELRRHQEELRRRYRYQHRRTDVGKFQTVVAILGLMFASTVFQLSYRRQKSIRMLEEESLYQAEKIERELGLQPEIPTKDRIWFDAESYKRANNQVQRINEERLQSRSQDRVRVDMRRLKEQTERQRQKKQLATEQ